MRDIILKITGKTVSSFPKPPESDNSEDPVEFITEGTMDVEGNVTTIIYEESELSGVAGCQTQLLISPGRLKMTRSGGDFSDATVMEFERGKRCKGFYETPMGSIAMEIVTDSVSDFMKVGKNTDRMSVEYDISLKGLVQARKVLDIEVVNKN